MDTMYVSQVPQNSACIKLKPFFPLYTCPVFIFLLLVNDILLYSARKLGVIFDIFSCILCCLENMCVPFCLPSVSALFYSYNCCHNLEFIISLTRLLQKSHKSSSWPPPFLLLYYPTYWREIEH